MLSLTLNLALEQADMSSFKRKTGHQRIEVLLMVLLAILVLLLVFVVL